jgi:hypothetical protein
MVEIIRMMNAEEEVRIEVYLMRKVKHPVARVSVT